MPTQFKLTTIIVLGAWNPSILTPAWLHKYKVIETLPDKPELNLEFATHRITFSAGDLTWSIDQSRLELRLKVLSDVGQYAARILGLLPHTPVRGIGTNFVFQCPASEWPQACSWQLSGVPLDISGAKQVQWSVVHTEKETQLSRTVTRRPDGDVQIAFNFHRPTSSAESAAEFAANWERDRDLAVEMLRSEFKIEI